MHFDAIIFDCDGVLVDSEILGLHDSADYLRDHGFDWTPGDLIRLFTGFRDDVFSERLSDAYRRIHGENPKKDFFNGLIDARRRKRHLLEAVAGAQNALNAIGGKRAVASSSREEILFRKLKRTGLFGHFEPHIYSAERVAHGKPAPDVFLYAAEKLCAEPERCLVIEDSENGVLAGRAAGMTVWGFLGGGHCFDGHGERLAQAGAHALIDDFDALARRLARKIA